LVFDVAESLAVLGSHPLVHKECLDGTPFFFDTAGFLQELLADNCDSVCSGCLLRSCEVGIPRVKIRLATVNVHGHLPAGSGAIEWPRAESSNEKELMFGLTACTGLDGGRDEVRVAHERIALAGQAAHE